MGREDFDGADNAGNAGLEEIGVKEAIERGYDWIRVGWNHRLNVPIMASMRSVASFLYKPMKVRDLEEWQVVGYTNYIESPLPETASNDFNESESRWVAAFRDAACA